MNYEINVQLNLYAIKILSFRYSKKLLKIAIIFCQILYFCDYNWSQSVTLELTKVEFYQPQNNNGNRGWITIADEKAAPLAPGSYDPATSLLLISTDASHTVAWSQNTIAKPVAYVSGYLPRIKATFKRDKNGFLNGCNNINPRIWIRAKWVVNDPPGGNPLILIGPIEITGTGNEVSIGPLSFKEPFTKDMVRYIQNFQLKWEYTYNINADDWEDAGTSIHPMYVTHREPSESLNTTSKYPSIFFYTTLHIGCQNANGLSSIWNIIESIYAGFEDQTVERIDGSGGMTYWGPYASGSGHVQDEWWFLNHKDGRCGDWAPFLGSIMKLHGIVEAPALSPGATGDYYSHNTTVTAYNYQIATDGGVLFPTGYLSNSTDITMMFNKIEDYFGTSLFDRNDPFNPNMPVSIFGNQIDSKAYSFFFVKNWNFSDGENKLYIYDPSVSTLMSPNGLVINSAENTGVAAQGPIQNPKSNFNNHNVMAYAESIYDPSYGSPSVEIFSNNQAPSWVNNSIAGVGALLSYRAPSGIRYPLIWLHKNTNINQYIKFN